MKKGTSKSKIFTANVDMNCSLDFRVKAKTRAEAKKKILAQLKRKLNQSHIDFCLDIED